MKTLKFADKLVPLVLSGEKTSTWRLFDDKNLQRGDALSLIDRETGKEFAKAKITKMREKRLGEITAEDFIGHERYDSREEMIDIFRRFYGDRVNADTMVKMLDFVLVKSN